MASAMATVIAIVAMLGASHAAGLNRTIPAWQRQACEAKDAQQASRYRCNEHGQLECFDGWTGDLCNVPICKPGCDPLNGYCTRPAECRCRIGFAGELCTECAVLPGCAHGTCTKSFECKCKPGWDGIFCSQAACKEGCHKSRGYCDVPGECRCRLGWTGESCEECQTLSGCKNGYCKKPFDCICKPGWTGLLCQNPICRKGCSQEHGYCEEPNQCRCRVGWWGSNCDVCHPYPGCVNGYCLKPWECRCKAGWTGFLCDKRASLCDLAGESCLNGGTCVELPHEVSNTSSHRCLCPDGFAGRRCADVVQSTHNEHASRPEAGQNEPVFIPISRGNAPIVDYSHLLGNSPAGNSRPDPPVDSTATNLHGNSDRTSIVYSQYRENVDTN